MSQWWRTLKQLLFKGDAEADAERTSQTNLPKKGDTGLSFGHWILILIALGLAAVILSNYFAPNDERPETLPQLTLDEEQLVEDEKQSIFTFGTKGEFISIQEYEAQLENELKEMLSKIKGVGEVSVMINLDSTAEAVVEKNVHTQESTTDEKDREGGNRQIRDQQRDEQVVILRQGDHEQPIVVKTTKPRVRGVLVVAPGAEKMQIKAWIMEAVQRVLDVPAHRVAVLPKNE